MFNISAYDDLGHVHQLNSFRIAIMEIRYLVPPIALCSLFRVFVVIITITKNLKNCIYVLKSSHTSIASASEELLLLLDIRGLIHLKLHASLIRKNIHTLLTWGLTTNYYYYLFTKYRFDNSLWLNRTKYTLRIYFETI